MVTLLVSIKLISEFLDDGNNPVVTLEVQYVLNGQSVTGEIQIEMYEDDAPMHVESFLTHAENFQYDGVEFHRVIDNFMIQGGDIENLRGSGGYSAHYYGFCNGEQVPESECRQKEDYTIPYEHENGLKHTVGAFAAAHAGLNTDGSQFYIVPTDGSAGHLDWEAGKDCTTRSCHTVFGYVISGMEHVDAISNLETQNDSPVDPVRIISARIA
ncbi:MAG: hypothetical protein CND84_01915 [Marine Group II euryarchaeote MED-G35]|nr:MAG: hypothetical protein CND84_01915 [Marine Group II euryarchaeote MED-G35]